MFSKSTSSCRLEEEEQARQKLQLEKVAIDSKLKGLEETTAALQDSNSKVCSMSIWVPQSYRAGGSCTLDQVVLVCVHVYVLGLFAHTHTHVTRDVTCFS